MAITACPACDAAPLAQDIARAAPQTGQIALSVPDLHCGLCIGKVETALTAVPQVTAARVNLTQKRVVVSGPKDMPLAPLIQALARAGYTAHELDLTNLSTTQIDAAGKDLLMRLAVAFFASMNVMMLSIAVWSGASDATRDLFHWISAIIAVPAVAFAGKPFFANALKALQQRQLNMDVPIVLAILLALGTSLWEVSLSGHHAYFDAALTLITFLLAGRYLDHRTRTAARSAAQELAALEVPRATRLHKGVALSVATSELKVNDIIQVAAGGRIPVDGILIEGQSELDRALLTGETQPVLAQPGLPVSAGEMNLSGPLTLRATAVGRDTSLHQMADLVAIAESGRANYTSLADKAAKLYAPGVHILAGLAFAGWFIATRDMRTALNIAAAVLIITCPCALGLAVPAVTTAASGKLFRKGLLVKNATALERLAQIDTLVFDKTGTLTEGRPEVQNLEAFHDDTLRIVLALTRGSDHPLSKSLSAAIQAKGLKSVPLRDIRETAGQGVSGDWLGTQVRLGRAEWVGATAFDQTAVYLDLGQDMPQAFLFQDNLREGAAQAIAQLKAQGLQLHMLSGDTEKAVASTAKRLGFCQWQAGILPQDKAAYIQALQQAGHRVLMVGDGLNDTGALAAAHASISPASALEAARVASDMVLLGGDLRSIAQAVQIAQTATRRIRQNFQIATLYNVIAVPLAIAGLATPLIAALAMSSSSITVSLNALRLRTS